MFSKKTLTVKNIFFALVILFVAASLVAPKDFLQKKEVLSGKSTKQVESVSKDQENTQPETLSQGTTQPQGQTSSPTQQNNQVKGATKTQTQTQPSQVTPNPGGSTNEAGEPVVQQVTLVINVTSSEKHTFQIDWISGMTVLDVLQKADAQNNIALETKDYGFGIYVYCIYHVNCDNWEYAVNGKKPGGVGAAVSAFKVQENDIITWGKAS